MKEESKQGNRQPSQEGRLLSLRSAEAGEETDQIINNGEGGGVGEEQLVKQERQQHQQQEVPQQERQQHQQQELSQRERQHTVSQESFGEQGGEVVLVAEAASSSSSNSICNSSSMKRSILPATLSSSEGNTPSTSDRPVEHDMMSGGSRAERVTMHPLASPSNGFEPVTTAVDGDSAGTVGNEADLDRAGGPEKTVMRESRPPTQSQSTSSSTLSPQVTPSQEVTADAGGIVIVSPATSASSRPGTATKGVQGFADDYRFGDNTQGSLFVRRKSQPAPRTTFGCVGGWKSEDPEAITGYPEESKSATPPPEESKLPERFLPEENVEPMEAAGAIEAPVDSKSMLLASLIETNRQPVQSSSAEQTADSGTGLTDAHPTTMAMVTSSSATEQHDKKSDRRTDAEAVDWRRSSSSDRFTYGGPSPSCASTSSSLVVAATATGQTGRVMGKKMNSPPIEVADMDVAVGVGEGEGQGTVGEVMPVTRSIRFGALPEGYRHEDGDDDVEGTGEVLRRGFSVTNEGMCSVIEAIESGIPEAVYTVARSMRQGLVVMELMARRYDNEGRLETPIILAALSGDVNIFNAVLHVMRRELTKDQVAEVLEAKELEGDRSLLSAAAEGGGVEVFQAVVEMMSGKVETVATMSADEAGYIIKMAAKGGNVQVFRATMDTITLGGKVARAMTMATQVGRDGMTAPMYAAASGNGAMVDLVMNFMIDLLHEEKLQAAITARGLQRMTVLMFAAESSSPEAVKAVLQSLEFMLQGNAERSGSGHRSTEAMPGTAAPVRSKRSLSYFVGKLHLSTGSISSAVPDTRHRVLEVITAKNSQGMTALSYATRGANMEIVKMVSTSMAKYLSPSQMVEAFSASFASCCAMVDKEVQDERLLVLKYLLQHGAKPDNKGLIRISTRVKYPRLKSCLLGAVSSADNPFIPGMNLSVALSVAARRALEGEKRALNTMQGAVDELLLEVLEHLPQTVRGFKGEMKACSAVFEPESVIPSKRGTEGPLSVALLKRQQMEKYCTIPLVLDFMGRKFSKGLPSIMDREGVLENFDNIEDPSRLLGEGLLADGKFFFLGMAVQRGYGDNKLSSITYFPGARFIIAGILSNPISYYKVPALRMMMDLLTYMIMSVIFGGIVLLHNGDANTDWSEIVFSLYIFGAITTEFREIVTDFWEYMQDKWNVLDVISLTLLLIGFISRYWGDPDVSRNLYALAAPLFFGRILFFAQILPSQGPMIQVIFAMTGELVKFGVVMLVVMLGFVMSFYSLFSTEDQTYGYVWLSLFKAMLGETEYFDDFDGSRFGAVATVLLCTYLVILTIMMLNLLVAVLSTAHAAVQENADREYKVSKARIIQHYVNVVETDTLPSPFNVMQMAFAFPFVIIDAILCFPDFRDRDGKKPAPGARRGLYSRARRFAGRAVFWATLGPFAIIAGALLWITSVVKAPSVVWMAYAYKPLWGRVIRTMLAIFCCLVFVPLWLVVMWMKGGGQALVGMFHFFWISCCAPRSRRVLGRAKREFSSSMPINRRRNSTIESDSEDEAVVKKMLKEAEGGLEVPELQRYLDDPMSDPDVRRDEETRATTVEHIKLLRNRLEATTKERVDELQAYFLRNSDMISQGQGVQGDDGREHEAEQMRAAQIAGSVGDEGDEAEAKPGKLTRVVNGRFYELEEKLEARMVTLEDRMGVIIDKRMGVLERKLNALLQRE